MKRLLTMFAAMAAALVMTQASQARTIDGFLAQCTAVAAGSCTEQTGTGYARQPTSFATLANGLTVNATPYAFLANLAGSVAGHAIYDAPGGGNLLVVMPLAAPLTVPALTDRGDVAALRFGLTALQGYATVEAYNGSFAAASAMGATSDGSVVTAGSNLTMTRGVLSANLGAVDSSSAQYTAVTGFAYQVPAGISTLDVIGAGTLATGTVTLQVAPANGALQRLMCGVTVTALTVTPGAGATIVGTAPNTCGPNASHELFYLAANHTWSVLF